VSRPVATLIVLSAITFFAGLGRPAIADSDEAFYAEAAREMLAANDWVTPRYNYEHRFQKPILFYWFVAAAYLVGGVSEFAARVPAALAGLGLSLVTYLYGRRVTDGATALLAGAIAATSFGYFSMARQSLPDLPLAFFITCATWALLESIDAVDRRSRRRWAIGAAAAMAGAFLVKGPVGIALPVIAAAPFALRALGSAEQRRGRAGDIAVAVGVFILLSAPWFVAMANRHGVAYLDRFFVGENLDRFATDRYNDPRPFWFYLPIVAGGMLPWSPFMLLWIPGIVRWLKGPRATSPLTQRLVMWSLTPLIFFTVSVGKQPRYILPMLPPLAVLLARAITHRSSRLAARGSHSSAGEPRAASSQPRDGLLATSGAFAGVLLVALGALIYRARPLLLAVSAGWIGVAAALIGVSGLAVTIVALSQRQSRLPLTVTLAGAVTLASLHYAILSTSGPEPVQRLAEHLSRHHQGDETVGTYRVFVRNLIFYTHVQQTDLLDEATLTTFLREHPDALAVVPRDDLARVEHMNGVHVRRLVEVPYFNTAGLKLRMLLWPDPVRDLDVVVLVGNR
jgi:4-amino-4-deoxy-L-arabinose transferase-like glycosyltransferase